MPIYEYDCQTCGKAFDRLVLRVNTRDEVRCPRCQSADVRKKLSQFASKVGGGGERGTSSSACTTST